MNVEADPKSTNHQRNQNATSGGFLAYDADDLRAEEWALVDIRLQGIYGIL